jgi:hypothetical protein
MEKTMKINLFGILAAVLLLSLAGMACDKGSDSEKSEDVAAEDTAASDEDVTSTEDQVGAQDSAVEDLQAADEAEGPPDEELPEVTFGVQDYTALQGIDTIEATWTDNVGVDRVEYYVDGELAGEVDLLTDELDTSAATPGEHELSLKVFDAAGNMVESDTAIVMLAGPGKFLPFTDAFTLEMVPGWGSYQQSVFEFVEEVEDAKGHIEMPDHMQKTICWMMWENEKSWDLGLDIGTGTCPHQGVKLAFDDLAGETGTMEVPYEDPDGEALQTGFWFAHVRFTDGLEHKGEKLTFHSLFWAGP